MARPGIVDVARLAGVSHQTVSRVVNDHPSVRRATRERVIAAIRELGYLPNVAARTLVTGRSRTIGVICYDTILYGPAAALVGIEESARNAGYLVSIVSAKSLERAPIEEAIGALRRQAVAGIIVMSPEAALPDAFAELPADMPAVAVWGPREAPIAVVAVEESAGASGATRHLLDLGHKTVWHLAGPPGRIGAEERIRGWRLALLAAGIEPPPHEVGDWSARSGYFAGRRLAANPEVTAIFVANDQMALGVLRALHEGCRRVPEEISLVGFDDIPDAAYFTPPLTTVRQEFAELGRRSAALLFSRIADAHAAAPQSLAMPTELVIRASTAPPPRR